MIKIGRGSVHGRFASRDLNVLSYVTENFYTCSIHLPLLFAYCVASGGFLNNYFYSSLIELAFYVFLVSVIYVLAKPYIAWCFTHLLENASTFVLSTHHSFPHRLLPFANLLSYVCASDRDTYKPAEATRDNEQWVDDDVTGTQHIKEVSTLLEIAYLTMVWLNRWKEDDGRSFTMHRKSEHPGQLRLLI